MRFPCVVLLLATLLLAGAHANCPAEEILSAQSGSISGELVYPGNGLAVPADCVWRIKVTVDNSKKQLFARFSNFAIHGPFSLTLSRNGTTGTTDTTFTSASSFPSTTYITSGLTNTAKEITVRLSYTGGVTAKYVSSGFQLAWGSTLDQCPSTSLFVPQMPVPQPNQYCMEFSNNSCCTAAEADATPPATSLQRRVSNETACYFYATMVTCSACSPDASKYIRINDTVGGGLGTYTKLGLCKPTCDLIWNACKGIKDNDSAERFETIYTTAQQFCVNALHAPGSTTIEVLNTDNCLNIASSASWIQPSVLLAFLLAFLAALATMA